MTTENTKTSRALSTLVALVMTAAAVTTGRLCWIYDWRFGRTDMSMSPMLAWLSPAVFIVGVLAVVLGFYDRKATGLQVGWILVLMTGLNVLIAQEKGGWATMLLPIIFTMAVWMAVRELYTNRTEDER